MTVPAGGASADLAEDIRVHAAALGFARVAFAPASRLPDAQARLAEWLAQGFAGSLDYLSTERADPQALLREARTVIVCAMRYDGAEALPEGPAPHGRIARYARGRDYHQVVRDRLINLATFVRTRTARPVFYRACVDTAPLLERELAARSGLGFIAKNTMLISPGIGSYTVLGELLVSVDIETGELEAPRCGRCTACIDICPTGALVGGQVLDARRCISYLTIELQGPIPRELRPLVGDWIFGCDLCQEVCPFNGSPTDVVVSDLKPRQSQARPSLRRLLSLGRAQFKKYVRRTALRRVRRRQFLRNVCVALGNVGSAEDHEALLLVLQGEKEPLVRGHAAWALGRLAAPRASLEAALAGESDPYVREEVEAALLASRGPC